MKARLWAMASVITLAATALVVGCSNEVDISIVTASPQNETITFDHEDDVVLAPEALLQVTVAETFDSYEWMLDGATLAGQTSATVSIDAIPLSTGVHHLSVFVEDSGLFYSKTLRFRIEN